MDNLNRIKQLYENGYRCIRTEQNTSQGMMVYLKNFEVETSEEISIQKPNEMQATMDFIKDQS